jgi:hypothetical protein
MALPASTPATAPPIARPPRMTPEPFNKSRLVNPSELFLFGIFISYSPFINDNNLSTIAITLHNDHGNALNSADFSSFKE